jgi:hypothetical protein
LDSTPEMSEWRRGYARAVRIASRKREDPELATTYGLSRAGGKARELGGKFVRAPLRLRRADRSIRPEGSAEKPGALENDSATIAPAEIRAAEAFAPSGPGVRRAAGA